VEYVAARALIGVLGAVPLRVASGFGSLLGVFAYSVVRIRRTLVEGQIRESFPEYTPERVRNVARASYANLGRVFVEGALLGRIGVQGLLSMVDQVDGWEHIEAARAGGRGIIALAAHLGNWELGGNYLPARGIQTVAVVRHMSNSLFERLVTEARRSIGMDVMFDDESVRQVPRALRENRLVGLLADHGAAGLASTFVPFFGRMAKTARGPAVFAMRFGAPMVLVTFVRQSSGKYRMIIEPIPARDTGDREADVDAIMLDYTQRLEHWIRQYPEQYFWQHNRWKHQPPPAHA
jgi:Kdo2-lipid IVA lauroyltransferase/acyltransferase